MCYQGTALVPSPTSTGIVHAAGTRNNRPPANCYPFGQRGQSHTLSVPRTRVKLQPASWAGRGLPHQSLLSKQPFVTGREGSEESLRQGLREQLCFLRSEDCKTEVKCQALHPNTQRTGGHKARLGAVQTAVTGRGWGIWKAGPTWVRQDALRPILQILAATRA